MTWERCENALQDWKCVVCTASCFSIFIFLSLLTVLGTGKKKKKQSWNLVNLISAPLDSVNSRSWWWTGRPGVLRFMGSQRVRHDWANDLIWSEPQVWKLWLKSYQNIFSPGWVDWFRSQQWSKMILPEWISGLLFGVPGLRHSLSLFFSRWNMWDEVCKNVILYQRDKADTWKSPEARDYWEINRDFQRTCWIYGSKPDKLSLAFSVWLNNPF